MICGDGTDSKNYPPIPVDLIEFDPPFTPKNKQYQQIRAENKNQMQPIETPTKEAYEAWWDRLCSTVQQILKPTGWFNYKADTWTMIKTAEITMKYFEYSNDVILKPDDSGPVYLELGDVAWDKGRIGLGRLIRIQHEQIICFTAISNEAKFWKYPTIMKPRMSKYRELVNNEVQMVREKKMWHGGSKGIAFSSILNVSNFNSGTLGEEKHFHINETPWEVWIPFIEYMCPVDGLILDLTMGTGSIAQAVRILNKRTGAHRRYWGIEIDPLFTECAKELIALSVADLENHNTQQILKKYNDLILIREGKKQPDKKKQQKIGVENYSH
jgi:hypothetical protein